VTKPLCPQLERLSAATLLVSWVTGCDPTVEQPPEPKRGAECVAACELTHPKGLEKYQVVVSVCACKRCSEECKAAVCYDKQTPSDACLPCVQESLGGPDCTEHAGLFGSGCLDYEECADFVGCVTGCEPIPAE